MRLLRQKSPLDPQHPDAVLRTSPNRRPMQAEAAGWGVMKAITDGFINVLLIGRGAGALQLGLYNSLANLFGYSAGFIGPRIAHRFGSIGRAALLILLIGRLLPIPLLAILWFTDGGYVWPILALVLASIACDGLSAPLWTAFLAGLVGSAQRGRWLAIRGAAAASAASVIMISMLVLFQFGDRSSALPFAYSLATIAGLFSLIKLRGLFATNDAPPPPVPRSIRSLPAGRDRRRFLGGVLIYWFGAGLIWPVLPPYLIKVLHAPPTYFALAGALGAVIGIVIQRLWGRYADHQGARAQLFFAGIGTAIIPVGWTLAPSIWFGPFIELFGFICWPAHTMGLTVRAIELAENESDRTSMIAWVNLMQGAGACISPLLSSALVGTTGTFAILLVSAALRFGGSLVMSEAESNRWYIGRGPLTIWKRSPARSG